MDEDDEFDPADMSNETLLRKHQQGLKIMEKMSPGQALNFNLHQMSLLLKEMRKRSIDPAKTLLTSQGVPIPCDSAGRPHRDEPDRFIRRRY